MPKSAPAPYPTPPARAPRWLFWLLPSLRGVENNPLFIKLTGQGFGRRRGLGMSLPPEFKRTRGGTVAGPVLVVLASFMGQVVLSGFVMPRAWGSQGPFFAFALFIAILHLSLAATMLLGMARLIAALAGVGANPSERQFLINAAREPWGQDICLTALSDAEIENAVIGAALWRSFSWIARATSLTFSIAFVSFLFFADDLSDREIIGVSLFSGPVALVIFFEALCLSFLRLGISVRWTAPSSRKERRAANAASLLSLLMFGLLHIPGITIILLAVEPGTGRLGPPGRALESWMVAAILTCALACVLGLPLGREYFCNDQGSFGRALQDWVRSGASQERPDA